jgi:hypothetical protein
MLDQNSSYLFRRNRLLAGLAQLLDGLLIVSEILLAADQNDRQALAEVKDLGDPLDELSVFQHGVSIPSVTYLLLNVVQRVGGIDSETNQNNVGVGVG